MVLPPQHKASAITIRGQGKVWGSRQELFTESGEKRHTSFVLTVHPTARGLGKVVICSSLGLHVCTHGFSFCSVRTLYDVVIYLATLEFQLLKFVLSSSTWNYHQRWQWGKEQCTAHQVCGTGVSIRTQRFLLFSLSSEYPRNARWNYLFPGFWEEKNGPEGHLELLMKALLLKSRVEVVRVGKGVRTSEQHQYWEDFIAKFPLPESW